MFANLPNLTKKNHISDLYAVPQISTTILDVCPALGPLLQIRTAASPLKDP